MCWCVLISSQHACIKTAVEQKVRTSITALNADIRPYLIAPLVTIGTVLMLCLVFVGVVGCFSSSLFAYFIL